MPQPDSHSPHGQPVFLPAGATAARTLMPRGTQPLQGLTFLVVEDSRFACDALRLMCQRSGARMRRAENLQAARAHLRVYRPDVVIVDLGLPDGRGEGLIRDLARLGSRVPVLLGTSGDAGGRAAALAAGASGFLEKPLESLAVFQRAILRHMPDRDCLSSGLAEAEVPLAPDPLALRDDLARAAGMIAAGPDAVQRRYLAGFVGGLARSVHDATLEQAAVDAARDEAGAGQGTARRLDRLAGLLATRLDHALPAFAVKGRNGMG
ncbi:response regulator [Paracoccaceae bacterium Fryx2]|nr:response regulator [Paracoccaceae bacterium Fryx2]